MKNHVSNPLFIVRSMLFFWVLAKCYSAPLWFASRQFPLAPVWAYTDGIPSIAHVILYGISIFGMTLVFIKPQIQWAIWMIVCTEIVSCILDQNRWQPWEFQYIFMSVCIAGYGSLRNISRIWMCMLSGIYIHSGLQKFNSGFLDEVWMKMIVLPLAGSDLGPFSIVVYKSGYILPLTELALGVLLLSRWKTQASWFLMTMHVCICLWLLWLNYNSVVIPWNVLMITVLLHIIKSNTQVDNPNPWLAVAIWVCLPFLNWLGWWDSYLSSSLYSGRITQAMICVKQPDKWIETKPYYFRSDWSVACDGYNALSVQRWAMSEMRVPPYPEERVYRHIFHTLQYRYPQANFSMAIFNGNPNHSSLKWLETRATAAPVPK